MKIYRCDFCDKDKPCTVTNIDNVNYDICVECKEERQAKLKGKGENTFLQINITRGRRWNDYLPYWPPLVFQPVQVPVNPLPSFPYIIYANNVGTSHDCDTSSGVQFSYTSDKPLNANSSLMLKQINT